MITIKHSNHHEPGTWKGLLVPTTDHAPYHYRTSASLTCPKCGKVASLTGHEIAADGTVSPSVICPSESCTFHEFIQLEGWQPTN